MDKNINNYIQDSVFKNYSDIIWVHLHSKKVPGENYDPYRNVGYDEVFQNPIPVKAVIHAMSGSSLVQKEIGLFAIGAIEIIVQKKDLSLIQNARKLQYKQKFYTTYNEALGNKVIITERPFNFVKIVCYLQGLA